MTPALAGPDGLTAPSGADAALLALLRAERERRAEARRFVWSLNARPDQRLPLGDWRTWLILAGRGWGKTRVGAETVRDWVASGACHRLAFVGATASDVRDLMVEGDSGILSVYAEDDPMRPTYEPSKRRVTWPNGAVATCYSADEPDRLRGANSDGAWADELAAWRQAQNAWDMLMFGLRKGKNPRVVVTTTPRAIPLIKALLADVATHLTRGRTLDNAANLAAPFLREIVAKYGGTRLGRQELDAEVLEDTPGAYWTLTQLDDLRVDTAPLDAKGEVRLRRIVVAVDPATTAGEESDFTAIVTVGLGYDGHCYVLSSEQLKVGPDTWSRRAWELYDKHSADAVVLETNQGGEMGVSVLATARRAMGKPKGRIKTVVAKRGKTLRADPVVLLYEQGTVHHVGPSISHRDLETQMSGFPVADDNDDLVDALVHGVTELTTVTASAQIVSWR